MRNPSEKDFFVTVEGVGEFRFGRRNYGDKARIKIEYLRYLREFAEDGDTLDDDLIAQVAVMAAYKVLVVSCPDGWESLEALDMVDDPDVEVKISRLVVAMNQKEDSFRRNSGAGSEESGA